MRLKWINLMSAMLLLAAVNIASCSDADFSADAPAIQGPEPEFEFDELPTQTQTQTPPPSQQDLTQVPDTLGDPDIEPGTGIFDRIRDFFGNLDFDKLTFPNNIDFGGFGEVFHLGDDNFSGSSCRLLISMRPLNGTVFRFSFQVTEPNTEVEVDIQRICGVDYTINTAELLRTDVQASVERNNIAPRARRHKFSKHVLQPGHYEVRVVSPPYTMSNGRIDHDDFIVGRVRISSDKPLVKGDVKAE